MIFNVISPKTINALHKNVYQQSYLSLIHVVKNNGLWNELQENMKMEVN